MGWYDAYGGKTANVNNKNRTSDSGLAMKQFGDAFQKIGIAMQKDELDTRKNKLLDNQIVNEQAKTENEAEQWVQKEDDKDYISNSMKHTKQSDFKDAYKVDDTNSPSPEAMTKVNEYFKSQDDLAQTKFNDTATKSATTGKYKTFDAFQDANKDLVAMADGSTMATIKKQFDNTSTQVKNLKTQQTINDLKSKVDKAELKVLQKSKENKGGYTKTTHKDILTQVKTSEGLDNDFNFTDEKGKKLNTKVGQIEYLARVNNWNSVRAIYAYEHQAEFNFTTDGTATPKENQVNPVKKDNTGKTQQTPAGDKKDFVLPTRKVPTFDETTRAGRIAKQRYESKLKFQKDLKDKKDNLKNEEIKESKKTGYWVNDVLVETGLK